MIDLDSIPLMLKDEKLDLLRRLTESDDWRDSFEPIYLKLVDDESPEVREAAVVALWDLANPAHIELLMDKVENDSETCVRAKAASVLGVFVYEGLFGDRVTQVQYLAVRKLLLDLANNPDETVAVRRMAIEAISFEADEPVRELIMWAYHHPSTELKMTAIFAMGRSHNERWFETILEELDSAEPRLRIEAINAAAEAQIELATPRLRNLALGKNKEARLAAIWALAYTRGPGAIETLEMCAESDDEEVARLAQDAVEEFYAGLAEDPTVEDEDGDGDGF